MPANSTATCIAYSFSIKAHWQVKYVVIKSRTLLCNYILLRSLICCNTKFPPNIVGGFGGKATHHDSACNDWVGSWARTITKAEHYIPPPQVELCINQRSKVITFFLHPWNATWWAFVRHIACSHWIVNKAADIECGRQRQNANALFLPSMSFSPSHSFLPAAFLYSTINRFGWKYFVSRGRTTGTNPLSRIQARVHHANSHPSYSGTQDREVPTCLYLAVKQWW